MKKAVGPVVVTALLFVVVVVSTVGFQGWQVEYLSGINYDIESRAAIRSDLQVRGFIDEVLYLYFDSSVDLSSLKVVDSAGTEMCSFKGSGEVDNASLVGWWTFDEIINNSVTLILLDYLGLGNNGILKD